MIELNMAKFNVKNPQTGEYEPLDGASQAKIQSDWNQTDNSAEDFIKNKPTIPPVQVNADWNAESGVAQILNKPTLGSAAFKNYTSSITSDSNDLVMSGAVYSAISTKADLENGKVPSSQLPSYVDNVAEYASTSAFPATGESGKIYIATDTNKTYRWSGSAYVEISESLALGETAGTAYAGNKGKANADAIAAIKDGTNIDSFADVETALAAKLNTADVDDALSSTSTNPVQNKAVQAPLATLIDNGAKNLLHIDNVRVFSAAGVTFTVNSDGTINTSGTATGAAYCSLTLGGTYESDQVYIDRFCDGNHMLAGCPAGGNYSSGYSMYAASGSYNKVDEGNGVLLTSSEATNIRIVIMIRQGTNANGLVFKPMICTNEDYTISQGFVPHAMSNLELTKKVTEFGVEQITVTLADMTFTKSNSGLYYSDSVDLSGSFSEIYAATMQNFNYVGNISIQPMIIDNASLSLTVCDPSSPSTLTFTNSTVTFVIFGRLK